MNGSVTNIETPASNLIPINTNIGSYASHIISAVILVAGLATLMYMMLGAFKWITSAGSKDKVQEAKDIITNAIIGLTLTVAAWAIYLLLDYFFGIGTTGKQTNATTRNRTEQQNICSSAPPTAVVCYGASFNSVVDDNWPGTNCGNNFTGDRNDTYRLVCRRTSGNNCAAVCTK